jgi:hypothetical protein
MGLDLRITLLSAGSFARGDGLAGQIDNEVAHDPTTGLPFLHGRTVKGLLGEECANILFSLGPAAAGGAAADYWAAGVLLFGAPGAGPGDEGALSVSHALMPKSLRAAVAKLLQDKPSIPSIPPREILEALTDVRRQTAASEHGAPIRGTLRSARVVSPGVMFVSRLTMPEDIEEDAKDLLSACVLGLRRGGTSRNRGRGRLEASLSGEDDYLRRFASKVKLVGARP